MLAKVFALAVSSPSRRRAFQRVVVGHLLFVCSAYLVLRSLGDAASVEILGHLLLVAGIVEGALLLGWRLTQLPKSQALEFLLVTPLWPSQVFLGEALVGFVQLAFVTLSGLPVLVLITLDGSLRPADTRRSPLAQVIQPSRRKSRSPRSEPSSRWPAKH